MQNALFECAKSKNDYQSRYDALTELYKDVETADIDAELTADLVGDYLFTDADFISHLSAEHRNVFQKIFDEIKYLCKVATAGSKEARQLEKVKKMFEEAYRAGTVTQKNTAEGGVKYSLCQLEDGRKFVDVNIDQTQFDGLSIAEMNNQAKKVIKSKYAGKVVGVDNKMFVNGRSAEKYVYYPHGTEESVVEAKARASTELDNLIDAGTNFRTAEDGADGHIHPDAVGGFSYFDTLFKVGNQYYRGTINIKNISKGKLFYGVTKVENITQDIHDSYGETPTVIFLRDASINSISPNDENVNRKNSLSSDSESDFPIKQGHYNVYGEDVKLDPRGDDFAPIREDAAKQNTVERDTVEDSLTLETKDADSFTQDTVSSFGIQKMGDYIHVQRQVFDTLLNEGFFTDIATRSRVVTNESTGMDIEINKKGIFETFNLNNYGRLGKFKKIAKLSTIRQIPDALKYGTVIADDIENMYNDGNNKTFAYIEYPTKVNGKDVVLKLAIKKSSQKNKFWVHSLYDVKSVSGSSASTDNSTEAGHITADTNKIVPQKPKGVKREFTEPEFVPPIKETTPKAEETVSSAEATEEVRNSASEGSEPSAPRTRKELHKGIVDRIKAKFSEKGLDLDSVLNKAKNLSTFSTVDNTPQRVMEKALGYKEGQILADETINKVAENETEGIKWLNSFTNRKDGILVQLSRKYGIKPGSKESAAAQH